MENTPNNEDEVNCDLSKCVEPAKNHFGRVAATAVVVVQCPNPVKVIY